VTRAVKDLKISTDKFAAQIPNLEEKVKHLENKVVDGLNEVRARELCLEGTTKANDDYQKQNAQLTKKLESKFPLSFKALFYS
jgi:predicted  nucleic acid-binding Zn-ribbon protein